MARKKKKPTRRTAKKKPSTKMPAATKKKAPKKATSVDALLKRFAKDRATKESQLDGLIKRRVDLEEKTRKYREQIEKLQQQEREARQVLAEMDRTRDKEVGELLATMGVKLGQGNAPNVESENKSEPRKDVLRAMGNGNHQ